MRPEARLGAAIEILDRLETVQSYLEDLMRGYFRERRYAGSGDRRAIGATVYGVLRRRGELDWRLSQAESRCDNRLRVFLLTTLERDPGLAEGPYGPEVPDEAERGALSAAVLCDMETAPAWARLNYPVWLEGEIAESLGPSHEDELRALCEGRAATDLRANTLKTDRDRLAGMLAEEGFATEPVALASHALRLTSDGRADQSRAFGQGLFEIQDAGSQFVAQLVGARQGQWIADICAGAGGKALAMAADMDNRGQIFAVDVDAGRLRRLGARAERAGVRNIQTRRQPAEAGWPDDWRGRMDAVLVDAPCSGSGTWRRQPELRWRMTAEGLARNAVRQGAMLDAAAELVKPSGRLVYITCSFLAAENEKPVTDFLARRTEFSLTPWREAATAAGLTDLPDAGGTEDFLRLTPLKQGVDGFFAAVMTRVFS